MTDKIKLFSKITGGWRMITQYYTDLSAAEWHVTFDFTVYESQLYV